MSGRAMPDRAVPGWAMPGRAKPGWAMPGWAVSGRAIRESHAMPSHPISSRPSQAWKLTFYLTHVSKICWILFYYSKLLSFARFPARGNYRQKNSRPNSNRGYISKVFGSWQLEAGFTKFHTRDKKKKLEAHYNGAIFLKYSPRFLAAGSWFH